MTRNVYDGDTTVWSPQGRLYQVEYAVEAVKLGSATVAIKSDKHAVLVALKRGLKLSNHQKKIIKIDNHIGATISGLTADARIIGKYLRTESLNYNYDFAQPIPLSRLMNCLAKKLQVTTQRYDKRPFGVGLLIIGYDNLQGPNIFEVKPNNILCCKAMAMGARSQSAKTYLEKKLLNFENCSLDVLIIEGLRAVRETLPSEQDLNSKTASILVVGEDLPLKELEEDEVDKYLRVVLQEKRRSNAEPDTRFEEANDQSSGEIFEEAQSSSASNL